MEKQDTLKVTVTTSIEVTKKRLSDLLCGAAEGGSAYWARSNDNNHKEVGAEYWFEAPLYENGFFTIEDQTYDKKYEYRVTLGEIEKGLQVMAELYPKHYADFMSENEDAITGDVFLQCCIFNEVIYG